MTHKEFVIWLKGFAKAANPYNVTPAQWEAIVEELDKVNDYPNSVSIGVGGFGITSTGTAFSTGSGAWHYTNSTNDKELLND
jgi:hypothetical protein